MREMNLLPRKTFLDKYLLVAHAAILGIGLALVLGQFSLSSGFDTARSLIVRDTDKLDKEIQQLSDLQVLDNRTVKYNEAFKEVEVLKSSRKDWLKELAYIVGYLPAGTDIINMSVDESALFQAELHFEDPMLLLGYLKKMYSEPRYENLKVVEFSKYVPDVQPVSETPIFESLPTEPTIVEQPELLPQSPEPSPSPGTEDDVLLNSLLEAKPEDLSKELKELLSNDREFNEKYIIEGDIWLKEDSPFTLSDILKRLLEVEQTPVPTQVAEPVVPDVEVPETPSAPIPEEVEAEKESEYFILKLAMTLQDPTKGSRQ